MLIQLTITTNLSLEGGQARSVHRSHAFLQGSSNTMYQDFLLDPFTYQYLNASFQRNQDPPVNYAGQYTTDILASKAYGFLDDAASAGNPFFLTIAPVAPHSDVSNVGKGVLDNSSSTFSAPIPAKRHEQLFKDVKVPRTDNFNPKKVCNSRDSFQSRPLTINHRHQA